VVAVWILNLVDAICTWFAVSSGIARELNPVMDYFIHQSWLAFFGVKIVMITAMLYVLYRLRHSQPGTVRGVLIFDLTLYSCICLSHLVGFIYLGIR